MLNPGAAILYCVGIAAGEKFEKLARQSFSSVAVTRSAVSGSAPGKALLVLVVGLPFPAAATRTFPAL